MPLDTTSYLSVSLLLLAGLLLLQGCSETTPSITETPSSTQLAQAEPAKTEPTLVSVKPAETEPKSIQQIAQEAMNSKGKLTKEQIDALIRANAACRPGDKHDKR